MYASLLQIVWREGPNRLPRRAIPRIRPPLLPMQLRAMRPHLGSQPDLLPHPEPVRPGSRPFTVRPPAQFVQGPAAGPVRSVGRSVLHIVVQPCLGFFKAIQLSIAIFNQCQLGAIRQVQLGGEQFDHQREAVAAFFKFFPYVQRAVFGRFHSDFSFFRCRWAVVY